MSVGPGELYLGAEVDPESGDRTGPPLGLPSHHLTTHGVVLGMTGSGKTGLAVVLLEEALLSGIPALILDPKGDMGNLLLNFPGLTAEEFRPWIDAAEALREGIEPEELAERTATRWRKGLAEWDLGPQNLAELRDRAECTIYTPGSTAGVPLDLIGSLRAPDAGSGLDAEVVRDEIQGFVSGLLGMAGIDADPISDPEHILLANIIEHEWSAGRDLDLARLIGLVRNPPMRKLGVFALDEFVPESDRTRLAMRLNGLVASSSFDSWSRGAPLDIQSLLHGPDGRPRAAIVHLAHLSDSERQFVVTLVLSRLVTWIRRQPGTSELRALVYMDEMFGFAPPTAEPPSKKPILTIFKQARAHGVGMVVATQNPVDLDYKAMSNAGTWIVGRLQTERDKLRVLEGLRSAGGTSDGSEMSRLIGGLRKREFLLRSTRAPEPVVFTSRWAMSFLRGALTREELARFRPDPSEDERSDPVADERPSPAVARDTASASSSTYATRSSTEEASDYTKHPGVRADESTVMPTVADSVPIYHLDPGAPWVEEIGSIPGSRRLEPALVARVQMTFDERAADLVHTQEWEAVFFPLGARFDPGAGVAVDYDERDLQATTPAGVVYAITDAPISQASFFRDAKTGLRDHLHREQKLEILKNPELALYSRPTESEEAFRARSDAAAGDWADGEAAKLKDRFDTRIGRVKDALVTAERRARELEVDVASRRQQEILTGAGRLLSMFIGGKANARSLSGFASRRSMTRRTRERLRTASEKLQDKESAIEDLETELADALVEIDDRAREMASRIEPVMIGLEKNDIAVVEMALVWVPVSPTG